MINSGERCKGNTTVEERPPAGCVDLCSKGLSFGTGDEKYVISPSTARLNSTACVSPTRTYSLRSRPSSSVSPGMTEPSVDNGLRVGRDTGRGDKFAVTLPIGGTGSVTSSLGGLQQVKVKTYFTQQADDHIPRRGSLPRVTCHLALSPPKVKLAWWNHCVRVQNLWWNPQVMFRNLSVIDWLMRWW